MFTPDKALVKELKRIIRKDLPFPAGWQAKTLHRIGGDMVFYVNRKLGLIAKAPMCIIGKETPGITLPTTKLCCGWVLQPLCTFDRRHEAVLELAKKVGPHPWMTYDFHFRNIGRYMGVPYLFDW